MASVAAMWCRSMGSGRVRRLRKTGNDEADAANLPVVLSLADGWDEPEAIAALVALLRSEHEIQPAIRDMLADAIEGSSEKLRIRISRKKRGKRPDRPNFVSAIEKVGRKLAIGKWIEEHPFKPSKLESVIEAAKAEFSITRAEAFEALALYRAGQEELKALRSDES